MPLFNTPFCSLKDPSDFDARPEPGLNCACTLACGGSECGGNGGLGGPWKLRLMELWWVMRSGWTPEPGITDWVSVLTRVTLVVSVKIWVVIRFVALTVVMCVGLIVWLLLRLRLFFENYIPYLFC